MIEFIKNNSCEYSVVLANDSSLAQHFAADQLISFIQQATAVNLPKIVANDNLPPRCILLGDHPRIKIENPEIDYEMLADEGYWWKFSENCIIIAGSKQRGTIYGVVSFLEQFLKIGFYDLEFTRIPPAANITLPILSEYKLPSFEYRMVTYLEKLDPDYAVFLKVNMNQFSEEEHGYAKGKFSMGHMSHTFNQLVPPKKYFKTHPEYYALVNGERVAGPISQLCLTNPDVMKIATETVLEWFKEDESVMSVGIVPNDCSGYCECEKCKAFEDAHGGVHSAPIINLCNKVGEQVARQFPDKMVHTIAYTYYLEPPQNMTMRDNILVAICDMYPDCCDNKPLGDHPSTVRYLEIIQEWGKLTSNMMAWHYCVDFIHFLLPFPNFRALHRNAQIYKENNFRGVLFQADTQAGVCGEFEALRNWFLNKLLWNCTTPYETLIDEFFPGFYGEAAPMVRRYFEEVQTMADDPRTHIHLYSGLDDMPALTKEFVVGWQKEFETFISTARESAEVIANIEKVLLGLDYTYLIFPVRYKALLGEIQPTDFKYRMPVYERFKLFIKKFGVRTISENLHVKTFLDRQDMICQKHSLLGLVELAPAVMQLVTSMLDTVEANLDDKGNFAMMDYMNSALKRGFHPLDLNGWMNEKNIGSYTADSDIWHKKFEKGKIDRILNPAVVETHKTDLPKAVGALMFGLYGQKEDLN